MNQLRSSLCNEICFPTLYKLTKMIHISFLRLSVPLVKKELQKVWFTFPFLRQTLHLSSFRSFAKDRCTRRRSCTRCNISWNIDSLQHPKRKLVSSSPLVRLYLGFFMDAAALSAGMAQQQIKHVLARQWPFHLRKDASPHVSIQLWP